MSEVVEASVEAQSTETKTGISAVDFEQQRMRELTERYAPVQEEEAEGQEPEAIEEELEAEEAAPEVEEVSEEEAQIQDVLSKIDLDSLSDEEQNLLREKLVPGAQKRINELTRRRKEAEEQLQEFMKTSEENPLAEKVEDNPYKELKDLKAIQTEAKNISLAIDELEDILWDADDYGPSDIVHKINGEDKTKSEVRDLLKNAKKARDTYLPDQFNRVRDAHEAQVVRQEYGRKAMEEFNWLKDPETSEAKQFVKIATHPSLEKVQSENPKLGAELTYLLAHAVNSLFGKKGPTVTPSKKEAVSKGFDLSPPKSPSASSARPEKSKSSTAKVLSDLSSRFSSSGSKDDFIALRTKQFGG